MVQANLETRQRKSWSCMDREAAEAVVKGVAYPRNGVCCSACHSEGP